MFWRLLITAIIILANWRRPEPMQREDVEATLDQLQREHAIRNGEQLDWRKSIVDLLKLLNQDPSLHYRRSLAAEFGHDGPFNGSAEQNQWLHEKVLEKFGAGDIKIEQS